MYDYKTLCKIQYKFGLDPITIQSFKIEYVVKKSRVFSGEKRAQPIRGGKDIGNIRRESWL